MLLDFFILAACTLALPIFALLSISFYRAYKFYTFHPFLLISHPKTRLYDIIPDHLVDRAEMKMRGLSLRSSDRFIRLCKV